VKGKTSAPYNIGSDEAINISDLAKLVDRTLGGSGVAVREKARAGISPKRYVPSVQRAKTELGLVQTVTLEQAIIKTARWHVWKEHL
jgi:dTDP-glucose 4,6-dehydratase